MPLSVGDKLGPYEILAPIGGGGMGVVYKARDNTRVAEENAQDAEPVREIKVLDALHARG